MYKGLRTMKWVNTNYMAVAPLRVKTISHDHVMIRSIINQYRLFSIHILVINTLEF